MFQPELGGICLLPGSELEPALGEPCSTVLGVSAPWSHHGLHLATNVLP